MSDEKKYTERDLVFARRAGVTTFLYSVWGWNRERAEGEAEKLYPLPKVTRARVIRRKVGHFGFDWRLVKNTLEYANPGEGDWEPYSPETGEWADVAAILNDLLANPTEEVQE